MVGEFVLQHHSEQNLDFHLLDNTSSMFHPLKGQIRGAIDKPATSDGKSIWGSCFWPFSTSSLIYRRVPRSIIVSSRRHNQQLLDAHVVGLQFRLPSCPQAASWQSAQKTAESHGGQFPSHPGRPGPETSSEGAHLTPNPQEIQAGFSPPAFAFREPSNLFTSITPSVPPSQPSSPRRQKSPRKFKASVRARANPRAAFPRARADEILLFARKNCRGRRGEKTENKVKQTRGGDQEEEEMKGEELVIRSVFQCAHKRVWF